MGLYGYRTQLFFIHCPDIAYLDIKCIQDYLDIAHMVKDIRVPNYRWAIVSIPSGLQVDAWGRHLQDYPDSRLIH